MDQSIIDASMQILIHSGDARRETYRAVEAMEQSEFAQATALLDAADGCIRQAHQVHTTLIQQEADGEQIAYAALFSHAQDTLMTAYSELRLVRKLLPVFRSQEERIRVLETAVAIASKTRNE
ncbi:PTS lactose/cellobiose transporter subunit IIA [Actinomyces ruminis]|uniref:PTS lactose/cellobiose transporter subunit IIA n=1 Tax=Actinomyces ruminis TaxID=1937003 RepID=A0ABX4MCW3_9ACTO|nr:PTS lactose/cellobiose transporter subunit IIA [Actinomyces ruminis]PHP53339.1 PTS lactose/cellobiose transporter subunit IIA [Actinomyces ruminis]